MEPLTMAKVEASLPLLAKEGYLSYQQINENKRPHKLVYWTRGANTYMNKE
jgi:hypothetical protein